MMATPDSFCRWDGPDLVVEVRVVARAQETRLVGVRNERLVVRLRNAPEDARANHELARHLAHWCGVRRGDVTIEHGQGARDKRVRIASPGTLPMTRGLGRSA